MARRMAHCVPSSDHVMTNDQQEYEYNAYHDLIE